MEENKKQRDFPLIGVEPVMFLYMAGIMTTTVVEESFFIFKACSVNLGYPVDICHNISDKAYKNYSDAVQVEVSIFHQYQNIAYFGIPVLFAFFLGAWSDRVGRKIPLLLGLFGALVYSIMIVVNALNESWRLEVILFTAALPCALSGGAVSIFMASFSYLSDTTTQNERTIRVTLLEAAYLLPMPLGIAFGSYLFSGPLFQSYSKMFMVHAAFQASAIIYTYFFIPRRTKAVCENQGPACSASHVTETLKTLFSPRKERRRLLLILCLIGIVLYTLQRDEKKMTQLYTLKVFNWGVKEFSQFKTFQSSFYIAGLLVGVPLLKKLFHLRDTYIMIIGAISHITARIFFIAANSPFWFYIGAVSAVFGPVVAPVLRSVTSKLVPTSERGKVFALFSVADITAPIASGFIFSQVYIHTAQTSFPGAIYLVTAVSQVIVFIIALSMNCILHGKNVVQATEETDERDSFN